MSGGFFRGTSADQDTRFSNKQAKLMKSQKFPPELDHLVDITKVKMDIIRPWIANRVTELLGFEDEVLINFIYGLLEGKLVNGKEVQISLTGFMEKNTGKFMKELWTLLLSAEKNASGVPQQILDAKEEETKMKKAETDRIANEIQKKREKASIELEQERLKKMDGGADAKATDADLNLSSKHGTSRASDTHPEDEKKSNGRAGTRGRNSRSPSRSISKSFSDSRSYSDDGRRSRSLSKSPDARGRSVSSERVYRSQRRRSISPRGRHSRRSPSPPRRRASYSRRRSRSRSLQRSPTPPRRRFRSPSRSLSPIHRTRRRSRSPARRRSPSPVRHRYVRHRSPLVRRRSPPPARRRSPSPFRRRSPSPFRRRSPPVRRRSPFTTRRRSPSPLRRRYQRSSSTPRRRSPSPLEQRRSRTPVHKRSPSLPNRSPSPSSDRHMSPSPNKRRSPVHSSEERNRTRGRLSPMGHQTPRSLKTQNDPHKKNAVLSPASEKSPDLSDDKSPYDSSMRKTRNRSLSPPHKSREEKLQQTTEKEKEKHHSREDGNNNKSKSSEKRSVQSSSGAKRKDHYDVEEPTPRSNESQAHPDRMGRREKTREMKSENSSLREGHPASPEPNKSPVVGKDDQKLDEKSQSHSNSIKESDQRRKSEAVPDNYRSGACDSDSEESDKLMDEKKGKRKHSRNERKEDASDDYSSDSEVEDKKEAKRRRKEEKKLRKEEKRRRREERRRKREEKRADKLKLKGHSDDYSSDDARKKSHGRRDDKETEQKRLEIELREKALEKLNAKKGMGQ